MSIFRRDSEPSPAPSSTAPSRPANAGRTSSASQPATHIAAGSKFSGTITGTTEVIVDGEVIGEIRVGNRVVVGPKGRVEGEVEARSVQLGGKVQGNVRASERVEILASGSLEGDVSAQRVAMAEGAVVNGKVQMNVDGTSFETKKNHKPQPVKASK